MNVGIFVGEPSGGLVVVDLDECDFPPTGARLPLTPTVKTGRDARRGYHLYYRSSGAVKNSTEAWGSVRARAPQYVVAPPSMHPITGRRYVWQLSLGEHQLADYADVRLPEFEYASKRSKLVSPPQHPIRPTEEFLLGRTHSDVALNSWLKAFDRDTSSVTAMALALGIDASLGKPFCCVLHPDRSPSAALCQTKGGDWLYHDMHGPSQGSPEWLTLAQVRAGLAGRSRSPRGPEHATWKLILLVEAGVLPLVRVTASPLPEEASDRARHVYERFLFLLGCRWNYTHGAPAPFTREFVAAFTGLTLWEARLAIEELVDLEAIYAAAEIGPARKRMRLFLPAGIGTDVQEDAA